MLKIYNSLSRGKEEFKPITPDKVRMYVCGMTVYDYCHLGHARVMVVFDMVARYLRASGFEVTYIRNITDIDDKIIHRANENGEDIADLTARFITAMHEDAAALGIEEPTQEPRATEHIDQIVQMISTLIEKEHAYVAANNDVFYDISTFTDYGKLSGKHLDELRAGERVEIQEAKDDPLDFVLWKAAKSDEPSWDSPWGPGRPGWPIRRGSRWSPSKPRATCSPPARPRCRSMSRSARRRSTSMRSSPSRTSCARETTFSGTPMRRAMMSAFERPGTPISSR